MHCETLDQDVRTAPISCHFFWKPQWTKSPATATLEILYLSKASLIRGLSVALWKLVWLRHKWRLLSSSSILHFFSPDGASLNFAPVYETCPHWRPLIPLVTYYDSWFQKASATMCADWMFNLLASKRRSEDISHNGTHSSRWPLLSPRRLGGRRTDKEIKCACVCVWVCVCLCGKKIQKRNKSAYLSRTQVIAPPSAVSCLSLSDKYHLLFAAKMKQHICCPVCMCVCVFVII